MPKNINETTQEELQLVPVPADTASHKSIIDEMNKQLLAAGHVVKKEIYYKNNVGDVATGVYIIDSAKEGTDMMISWTNSYDKTMKFKCAVGAFIESNESFIIVDDSSTVKINHQDKPDIKVTNTIAAQISNLSTQYNLSTNIAPMNVELSDTELANLLGQLYFNDSLSISQLSKLKNSCKKDVRNLFDIYKLSADIIKSSHPRTWMEQHREVYNLMIDHKVSDVAVLSDPDQINLLDQIDEAERGSVDDISPEPLDLANYGLTEDEIAEKNKVEEIVAKEPEEEVQLDLNDLGSSDDEEPDAELKVQDPDALTLDAHDPVAEEFPEPPADLPVYGDVDNDALESDPQPVTQDEPCETAKELLGEEATPLEEQVAGEFPSIVSAAEKEVSKEPIVDEPEEKPQEDTSYLDNGPTEDPIFTPEEKTTSDSPFDF